MAAKANDTSLLLHIRILYTCLIIVTLGSVGSFWLCFHQIKRLRSDFEGQIVRKGTAEFDNNADRVFSLDAADTRVHLRAPTESEGKVLREKQSLDEHLLRVKRHALRHKTDKPVIAEGSGAPDDWMWLTSYARVPVYAIQEFCKATKDYCPPGAQGPPGLKGDKGEIGEPGESGPPGFPGVVGAKGQKGEAGGPGKANGPAGKGEPGAWLSHVFSGVHNKGDKGVHGLIGLPASGCDRESGLTCPPGPPGPAGPPGPPGPPGRNGSDGMNGVAGEPGRNGTDGLPGPRGPRGRRGKAGPKGDRGEPGKTGDAGPRGFRGLPGERGVPGTPGSEGKQVNCTCEKGQKGDRGEKGKRGLIGFIGYKGEPGLPGMAGPPGPVVEGPPGPRGMSGPQGPKGQKGDKGDPGRFMAGSELRLETTRRTTTTTTPKPTTTIRTTTVEPTLEPRRYNCTIQMVGKPLFQRYTGTYWGSWMRDPEPPRSAHFRGRYWFTRHFEGKLLYEYQSLEDFRNDRVDKTYELKELYFGTGHVIYRGSFYYHHAGHNELVRYDLRKQSTVAKASLPGAAFRGKQYVFSVEYNYFDLAVDENGLWVLYGIDGRPKDFMVAKLDPRHLRIQKTWNLTLNHHKFGNGFITCGVLYLIRNTSTKSTLIDFAYDLYTKRKLPTRLKFLNPFQMNNMISYNPLDKKLYSWDRGNQLTYPLLIKD